MSNPSKAATEVVQDTAQVVNKDWEVIQKKTFTNWINSQLKNKSIAPVEDLSTGLASGEKLIQLLEIIGAESLGRYTKNPKLRLQKNRKLQHGSRFYQETRSQSDQHWC
jgi:hypothetical protein